MKLLAKWASVFLLSTMLADAAVWAQPPVGQADQPPSPTASPPTSAAVAPQEPLGQGQPRPDERSPEQRDQASPTETSDNSPAAPAQPEIPTPSARERQELARDIQRRVARRSLASPQIRTTNLFARGSGRINIISDLFGAGQSTLTVAIPFSFANVQPAVLGPNALGFNVGGSPALDLFTVGGPDADRNFALAEPIPPTAAPIPNDPGFQYAGGMATNTQPGVPATNPAPYDLHYAYANTLLVPGGSNLLLGRQKIASNVSPMPRTRIFADYSYFDNTLLLGGSAVHRWTPGFEYAFDDETSSIEFRAPMGITLDSEILSGMPDNSHYEFGNLFFAWKSLLLERQTWLLSGGLSVTVPTAENVNVYRGTDLATAQRLLEIRNESVHVQPFVGWLVQRGKLFTQGFCQLDVDVNGSTVNVNRDVNQTQLTQLGVVQDASLLYVDMQFGYWLRRLDRTRRNRRSGVTGLATIWELHVNRSLQASDIVGSTTDFAASGGYQVGSPISDVQIINSVVGLMLEKEFDSQLYLGFATPLGNGADAPFDGELRVAFNRFY